MAVGIPDPHEMWVVNNVGAGLKATLEAHLAGVMVLARAKEAFRVDYGPLGDDWVQLVGNLGTWVRGNGPEVKRFVEAWREEAGDRGIAIAPTIVR